MFNEFSEEARKIMVSAKEEMYSLKHPYVGSEHLLLAILKNDNDVSKKLKESKLTYDTFKNEIVNTIGIGSNPSKWFLYTPLLKRIIENAIIDSKENNNGIVTVEHLFIGLLEEGEGVAIRILLSMNIDIDELYQEFSYKIVNITKCKKSKNKGGICHGNKSNAKKSKKFIFIRFYSSSFNYRSNCCIFGLPINYSKKGASRTRKNI